MIGLLSRRLERMATTALSALLAAATRQMVGTMSGPVASKLQVGLHNFFPDQGCDLTSSFYTAVATKYATENPYPLAPVLHSADNSYLQVRGESVFVSCAS
jgi:hypothetical protein